MSTAEPQYQLFANAIDAQSGHVVIAQTLNQWRDYTGPDGKVKQLYFGVDNFKGTEPEWDNTPLIYSDKAHPSVAYRIDPNAALTSSGGKVVGSFSDASTVLNGTPRFEGSFSFSDPEVQALHDAGELQFSTGFYSDIDDDGRLKGKVSPDHILVFKKSRDGLQPQDKGAMFLNATVSKMTENTSDIAGLFTQILAAIKSLSPAKEKATVTNATEVPTMTDELTNKIAVLNATIETQTSALTEKDAMIAELTGKVQAFEAERTQALEAKADADWQNIKTNVLAPGLTATPELEAEQKAAWQSDKDGFYCNAIAAAATRPAPKGKAGELFANAAGNPDAEMDAILSARPGVPGTFH